MDIPNHAPHGYYDETAEAQFDMSRMEANMDCEYHDLSAEETLRAIVDAMDSHALLDVLGDAISDMGVADNDTFPGWAILQAAMCRVREIVAELPPPDDLSDIPF